MLGKFHSLGGMRPEMIINHLFIFHSQAQQTKVIIMLCFCFRNLFMDLLFFFKYKFYLQ